MGFIDEIKAKAKTSKKSEEVYEGANEGYNKINSSRKRGVTTKWRNKHFWY